jgi:hypothetical protein
MHVLGFLAHMVSHAFLRFCIKHGGSERLIMAGEEKAPWCLPEPSAGLTATETFLSYQMEEPEHGQKMRSEGVSHAL